MLFCVNAYLVLGFLYSLWVSHRELTELSLDITRDRELEFSRHSRLLTMFACSFICIGTYLLLSLTEGGVPNVSKAIACVHFIYCEYAVGYFFRLSSKGRAVPA